MNIKTIKVDLSLFFDDERKMSCILVDPSWKTVECLQKRVEHLFDIRSVLFLSDGCYLPSKEPIDIIRYCDVVKAFVLKETQDVRKRKKSKKSKEILEKSENNTEKIANDELVTSTRDLNGTSSISLKTNKMLAGGNKQQESFSSKNESNPSKKRKTVCDETSIRFSELACSTLLNNSNILKECSNDQQLSSSKTPDNDANMSARHRTKNLLSTTLNEKNLPEECNKNQKLSGSKNPNNPFKKYKSSKAHIYFDETGDILSPKSQADGADDLLKTPTKVARAIREKSLPRTPSTPKSRRLTLGSPCRSPKTPKTGHKYAQLPLVSVNRSALKTTNANCSNGITPLKEDAINRHSLSLFSLRKNLALSDLRRKSISVDTNVQDYVTVPIKSRSHKLSTKTETLDKTHITCALKPLRTNKKSLKVYKVENGYNNRDGSNKTSADASNKGHKRLECFKTRKTEFASQNKETNNLSPTISKNSKKSTSSSETDEEIVESDHEAEKSSNFKQLRRSFIAKRDKTRTSAALMSSSADDSSNICNKSKPKLTAKKCLVKLKRIGKIIQSDCGNTETKDKNEMKKCNIEVDVQQRHNSFVEQMIKEKESYENLLLTTYTDCQQKTTQFLNNSQTTFALDEKLPENFETCDSSKKNFITTYAVDNLTDSLTCDLSDEVIEDTPPQSSDKSLAPKHSNSKAISLQSPCLFTQNFSPLFDNSIQQNFKTTSTTNSLQSEPYTLSSDNCSTLSPQAKVIITPLDLPPSREEVLNGCHKLQLPEFEFQQPFYSNPDDITKHKELGFTILQIPGNKLNDVEEFESILGADLKGLSSWRREQLGRLGGAEMLNRYRNTQRIREYFSNQKPVIITPQFDAPTRQEVKMWLKAIELIKNKDEVLKEMKSKSLDEDSPIKIKRQKVTLMLNAENSGKDNSDDDSLNCSLNSLSLTPLTPAAAQYKITQKPAQTFTPVTRNSGFKITLKRDTSLRKRNNCRVLRRVSLNKQLKEAFEREGTSGIAVKDGEECTNPSDIIQAKQESVVQSSQRSETSVSSETVLAQLERSSFVRQLKETDITLGGFTNNSTLNNSFGFKVALENLQQAKADIEFNYLTIITLEVFVGTREDLYPNPEQDEIRCLFYAIENSIPNDHNAIIGEQLPRKSCGYIMVHDDRDSVAKEGRIHGIDSDIDVTIVQTEVEALESLLGLCSRWDPDIYAGYEIEMSSWGFVIERAKFLCLNIAPLLSRVPTQKVRDFVDEDRESFTDLDVEMKLCGRILLDVWRLLRSEIALTSYSFENVMYHILHKRCPWHSYRNLTEWFAAPCSRWIVIEYYLERVRGTLALLDQLDLIGRTSEMAKLIGIQFYEVLSRGSQFRVESMMLRIAKPKNLVPLSPSVQQRAHMRAPEYLALIMEPQSRFYADPLIVLDFQSLYPSMIIAYNYCFSTCLGRVEHLGQSTPFEFGASQLRVSPAMLRKLVDNDLVTISPCGVVFVKSSVREGILPRMLTEILDTRQMVKQSMKLHKSNSALQRILHSRQLGLKLMANVTYGYTAANFSGRMPAVEVGDSVVSKGRETLERAIKMVEANDKWNVRVVYGDTDSMFVLVPGRNREEAFRIGEEIAEAVTKQNPHPVKLKLEKVYQPCILQTKKRYVGYMYESADQKEPVYEAKGIETVRRDGCPLVAKMLEKVLRILFETADVSQVKHYVCRQFTKLLAGRSNLQDLIFAKEFRGLNGYRPTACVPALELTRKWIQTDPRRIPRRGERVPFIITNGPPGVPLIRLVRHPHEVLNDEGLKINAVYYITKAIIPPLNRCLLLIGADANEWFASLPRKILLTPALSIANEIISCPNAKSKKSTISQFFSTTNCITDCGRQTKEGICSSCSQNSTRSVVILQMKISNIERAYLTTQNICQACCGRVGDLKCGSLDCPVLYVLEGKRRDLQQLMHFRNLMEERFK